MRQLILMAWAALLCFCLLAMPAYADPGDEGESGTPPGTDGSETDTTNPNYPPPPEGWEGPWPPPDWDPMLDGGGPPPPTGDGGDDTSWGLPGE